MIQLFIRTYYNILYDLGIKILWLEIPEVLVTGSLPPVD